MYFMYVTYFISCKHVLELFVIFQFGNYKYEHVEKAKVQCEVLEGIECFGPRSFNKDGFPCVKYTGQYFVTTLMYSILLGFLGMKDGTFSMYE